MDPNTPITGTDIIVLLILAVLIICAIKIIIGFFK